MKRHRFENGDKKKSYILPLPSSFSDNFVWTIHENTGMGFSNDGVEVWTGENKTKMVVGFFKMKTETFHIVIFLFSVAGTSGKVCSFFSEVNFA